MQSPAAPGHKTTPSTSPLVSPTTAMSPGSPSSAEGSDPLVLELAQKIAHVINDFKRELDTRDGDWANVHGQIELALEWQNFILTVEPDELGDEYPIKITAKIKTDEANGTGPAEPSDDSDTNLNNNLALRKKRRSDEDGDSLSKRQRTAHEGQSTMPVITKDDLNDLLTKLRDETQDDISECVNHVEELLLRFNEESHALTAPDYEQPRNRPPAYGSMPSGNTPVPPPSESREFPATASLTNVVRGEVKVLSSQIKWVEDCRRLASDTQIQCEETWRTSSAGFHDRARQNREDFQNTTLHQQGAQGQILQQILNEVKAFALYAQSCKWEVPGEMPGRGMGLGHGSQMTPVNTGHTGGARARPSMGQQTFTYLPGRPNAPERRSQSGALPPFPQ